MKFTINDKHLDVSEKIRSKTLAQDVFDKRWWGKDTDQISVRDL